MKEDLPNFIPFAPEKKPSKFSKNDTSTGERELIKSFNMPRFNLCIAGGRDVYLLYPTLLDFVARMIPPSTAIQLLIGDCPTGIDLCVTTMAQHYQLPCATFFTDWQRPTRLALQERNRRMIDQAHALLVIWNGESHGSRSTLNLAKAKGIPITEVTIRQHNESKERI